MGLASALSTALTGMNAAETSIDVIGNNLANSSTVGFKASTADFATQFLQTQQLGSAPSADSGGTDPTQSGLGVMVANIAPNFSQGTISISSNPSDLAIQGDGLFVMQGAGGQQLYTRNGQFTMNSDNELVNSTGNRVLGYGVNGDFVTNTSTLEPLSIPLGTATVAQATQNVVLQGSLSPTGTIANEASILQTGVLGDAQYSAPTTAPTATDDGAGTVPAGTYQYYVTYSNGTSVSRPSPISLPITVTSSSQITVTIPKDTSGQWTDAEVYRNDSTDPNTFYQVDDVKGGASQSGLTFTDNLTDAQVTAGATLSNMNGPSIETSTLLTNLISRDSNGNYDNVFPSTGSLSFTGNKGNADLAAKTFTVTNTSTVGDLMTFMQQAMGIQTSPGPDAANPIPPDSVSGLYPGGYVTDSSLQLVGNNGADNAISVGLSALQLTTSGEPPQTEAINLPFNTIQTAAGQSAETDMVAYDSLGIPLQVHITAVLQDTTSSSTVYRWFADCSNNDPGGNSSEIAVGTGLVTFDGSGNFVSATNDTVSVGRANEPSVKPTEFTLNFSQVSGLATSTSSLAVASQDGSAPGTLASYQISTDGTISGVFSNGVTRNLGQVVLAKFANPDGLEQEGQNMYAAGVNSGLPVVGSPGTQGIGTITAGAVELSNADVGTNLINLITASTMYESNSRVITTTQQLFQDLLSLQPAA
jgi:flagellar hook protein FlgE